MSSQDDSDRSHLFVGQLALGLGFFGIAALILAPAGGLPADLRWRVVQNAPAWMTASLVLIGVGIGLLWTARHPRVSWSPTLPGKRFTSLVVYTKPDCPLCDTAVEMLETYREWLPPVSEVDIEGDEQLLARFQRHIPVVEIDGRVRFRGRISELLLRRLIEASPAAPSLRLR